MADPSDERRSEDTALVERVRAGDTAAFGELYDRWFDRVYDLAVRITRDQPGAGDVAHDAFLAAWRSLPQLERPDAFGGWLLRITRNQALNRQRKEQRSTALDTEGMEVIERAGVGAEDRVTNAEDPARAVEDSEIVTLVWDAVDALGERDAELLDLTLRHGLNPADVADVVGTNRNAANQMIHRARNRLKDAVAARVLWRGGVPQCGDLADALAAENVTHFGRDAMRITNAHAPTCAVCSTRQALRLDPAQLFGAVPFLVAPIALRTKVAHAMEADGVPIDGLAAPEPRRVRTRRRRAARVAVGVIVVVVAALAIGLLAEEVDYGTIETEVAASPTSTTFPTGVTWIRPLPAFTSPIRPIPPLPTANTLPPLPRLNVPAPEPPPADPAPDPGPPVDPVPPPTAAISVTPSSAPQTYLADSAPVVAWTTSGGSNVSVRGPGLSSTDASGSIAICPTASSPDWSLCVAAPGDYTYTVTIVGDNGDTVSDSVTLTIE